MQNIIIGTAGHIDHGKTALIKALTGVETDRLPEEKKRGITIESGFAYLDAPDGVRLGIIDVPGHEKFIGNMLACASGIDLALLVVAADEGIMPQTREHLDILGLLGVKRGIIVLTKADLVDSETLAKTGKYVKNAVAATFLKDADIVAVSSKTGDGIDNLRTQIFIESAKIPTKHGTGGFRLPVDRVFSVVGFGTVVTGTLTDGTLNLSDSASLYPSDAPVRIRGLEVHSQPVEAAFAGQRVAVNLAVKKEEVSRGDVLAETGSLKPTLLLQVNLEVLKNALFSVKNRSRVHVYLGAKKLVGKVVLLGKTMLNPDQKCEAQVYFDEPVTAKVGDHFIIRFYSPQVTIGGGVVIDAAPTKFRKEKIESKAKISKKNLAKSNRELPLDRLEQIYLDYGVNPSAASVAMPDLDEKLRINALIELVRLDKLVRLDDTVYIHKQHYEAALELFLQLAMVGNVQLGQYRNALCTSRRVAVLLLEYFDKAKISIKTEDGRTLF